MKSGACSCDRPVSCRWAMRIRALCFCTILIGLLYAQAAHAGFAAFPWSAWATGSPPAAAAPGQRDPLPTLQAHRIARDQAIQVDGRLDDLPWEKAETAWGFKVWNPDRGREPSEPTLFKAAYDARAIYFALACHEADPKRVTKKLSRRDRFSNSDLVSIYIDPYHDESTAYNFRVNPLGVQEDKYIYNDGEEQDQDWDAVWTAKTYEDGDGWYAEIRIPFSSIRYRADASTWGLQVYRYMHGRGEDTAWVIWDRDTPGFVSRFGHLTGLRDIPAPRQLELLPYAVYRATDPSTPGHERIDNFENLGVDLKYGVTADLCLNATFQPDFGQVEADPAVLNLSPFETFFQEKRPFFVEGSRFFEQPDFNLFHSRRIGTGDENSRIRYAAKLTGKTARGLSVAALFASTDITQQGQAHNFLKEGSRLSRYFVARFGKESDSGGHRFHLMQTATVNTGGRDRYGDRGSREAYTTGADFDLRFRDRAYVVQGSFVGSLIDPEPMRSDPAFKPSRSYGTGGHIEMRRDGGTVRGGVFSRWETDKLDLNDAGYLQAPDEMDAGGWIWYPYSPDGGSKIVNEGSFNLSLTRSWLYAGRTGFDLHTGEPIWSYSRGHRQFLNTELDCWLQLRNFAEVWTGGVYNAEGTQRYDTRSTVTLQKGDDAPIPGGGPLLDEPATYGGWFGASTDSRKDLVCSLSGRYFRDSARNVSVQGETGVQWSQTSALNHKLELSFQERIDDTQHLGNFENPGGGIGGVSYVFGKIHQKTVDLTLRTSLLFSTQQSLEVYAQPFITVGDYTSARELTRPDSYDLSHYTANDFRAEDFDFSYSSVNLNVVYRWEYLPGSALFLVWTQNRESYAERKLSGLPGSFDNSLRTGALFDDEAKNVFLAKITYWFPI